MRSCALLHIAILFCLLAPAARATDVSGNVSGQWTLSGSPYRVIANVTIPASESLTIDPGVQVLFTGQYKFTIYGDLQAIGTERDSIRFTRESPTEASRGRGLRFETGSDGHLEYAVIEWGRAWGNVYENIGGGIACWQASPTIRHCTIAHNTAYRSGGGLVVSEGFPLIEYCVFADNTATGEDGGAGGGVAYWHSGGTINRCLFADNYCLGSSYGGGALHFGPGVAPTLTNCTFVHNTAAVGRGGIDYLGFDDPAVTNCIIWDNTGPDQSSFGSFRYSDVQYGNSGGGCIEVDPLFVDPEHGDFHLQALSPCIDTGDPASPPDSDGTRADMGAYPYAPAWTTLHFPGGFSGLGCPCSYPVTLRDGSQVWLRLDRTLDGLSPDDSSIASFSLTAGAGLPPWDGYWTPQPDVGFRTSDYYVQLITDDCCWLNDSLEWIAGSIATVYAAGWTCGEGGDPASTCGAAAAEVSTPRTLEWPYFVGGEVSGVWAPEPGMPIIVIDDLIVPAGDSLLILPGTRVLFQQHYKFNVYGKLTAIGTEQDSIIFTRVDTTDASRWWGIRAEYAVSCSLAYCRLEAGRATYDDGWGQYGGALFSLNTPVWVSHCRFVQNQSNEGGGALHIQQATAHIEHSIFAGNHGDGSWGNGSGAVAVVQSGVTIDRCLFVGNTVSHGSCGSAVAYDSWPTQLTISNCTFARNSAPLCGGPVFGSAGPEALLINCISWDNVPENRLYGGVAYSDVIDRWEGGEGNIDADPRFQNPDSGDYQLRYDSPCVNAGDPSWPPDPDGTRVDMGAVAFVQRWTVLHFPGGFAQLGCPCAYPISLRDGSEVWLRYDSTGNGVSPDDPPVSSFVVGAGAGLPPWDGHWVPWPGDQLAVAVYYVQVVTDVCCWLSGSFEFNGQDTITVNPETWTCDEGHDPWDRCGALNGTPLCGNLDGVLTRAGSPYIVDCEISVQHGDTLFIEPGVHLLFNGHHPFHIMGKLIAAGTEQDSIVFTRRYPDPAYNWWGIRFYEDSDDQSRLEHCLIEYAVKGEGNDSDTNGGGLLCENSSPTFRHCTVRYCEASRGGGIMVWAWSQPVIDHCLFAHNRAPYSRFGGGVWVALLGGTVSNSTIVHNWPDGLYSEVGVELANTVIAFNDGKAVSGAPDVDARFCNFFANSDGTGEAPPPRVMRVNVNGDSCDTDFNIFLDPLFTDTALGDYRLLAASPCIDAGDTLSARDPDGSIADIGAISRWQRGPAFIDPEQGNPPFPPVDSLVIHCDNAISVHLSWRAATYTRLGRTIPVSRYIVYRAADVDGPYVRLGESTTTSFRDPIHRDGRPANHFYVVTAVAE